mgnify:CR=1 FL=1
MQNETNLCKKKWRTTINCVAILLLSLSLTGCGGSQSANQPAQQQVQAAAPSGDNQAAEKAYKDACQELELRGLNGTYTKYINKQVRAEGPITEVQKMNDNTVRVKIQYPDTDAVWVTSERPVVFQPKVGKRMEFWGVVKGKGEKTKLTEVTAKYIKVI